MVSLAIKNTFCRWDKVVTSYRNFTIVDLEQRTFYRARDTTYETRPNILQYINLTFFFRAKSW